MTTWDDGKVQGFVRDAWPGIVQVCRDPEVQRLAKVAATDVARVTRSVGAVARQVTTVWATRDGVGLEPAAR